MQRQNEENESRRKIAYVSIFGTTQLHLRNPLIIAWWSAAFPGLGYLLLSKYLRGFLLFFCEIIINCQANINYAIYYSFIGDIARAKAVLNKEWMLLYAGIYIFSIWDSYRTAVDINNVYKLAVREGANIQPFQIKSLEINYLDKRIPINAFLWSLLLPGAGQLYIHRIITAAFVLFWWITIVYMSKLLPAIHHSFSGDFEQAKSVLDIHWLLNFPSIYFFPAYDAYVNTVENNKLYDWEQSKFLKREYQYEKFKMPIEKGKKRSSLMYIIATFVCSSYLELAITAIQMKGVSKERILAVPMDRRGEERKLFDTIHYSDGLSLIDLGAILGTICMLFGCIYGFLLIWGPIWWGLIGLGFGLGLGVIIKVITTKKYSADRNNKQNGIEVVLIIECEKYEKEMVKNILWDHHALGISQLDFMDFTSLGNGSNEVKGY